MGCDVNLFIVIAVGEAPVPTFIVLLSYYLQAVAKRLPFVHCYQALHDLFNRSYLLRDGGACSESSMDSKLLGMAGSHVKNRWEAVKYREQQGRVVSKIR